MNLRTQRLNVQMVLRRMTRARRPGEDEDQWRRHLAFIRECRETHTRLLAAEMVEALVQVIEDEDRQLHEGAEVER